MSGYLLETVGLKEALAGMERVERLDVQRDLKSVFNDLASTAVTNAKAGASTKMERRAASTLAVASTSLGAALKFGKGFEGAFGAEYGADKNKRRVVTHFGYYQGWNQFKSWRGSGSTAGYFMWPGIRAAIESDIGKVAESVTALVERPAANIAAGAALINEVMGV